MSSLPDRLTSLPPAILDAPAVQRSPRAGGTSLLRRPEEPPAEKASSSQPAPAAADKPARGRPVLKSQQMMTASRQRREQEEDSSRERGVFAMDIDDEDEAMQQTVEGGSPAVGPAPTGGAASSSNVDVADGGAASAAPAPSRAHSAKQPPPAAGSSSSSGGSSSTSATMPPPASHGSSAVKASPVSVGKAGSFPSPRQLPLAAGMPEPTRKQSSQGQSRRSSEVGPPAGVDRAEKKPRRHGGAASFSAPNTPNIGPAGTPVLGPTAATKQAGPQPMVLSQTSPRLGPSGNGSLKPSRAGSNTASAAASPRLGPSTTASPRLGPSASVLAPLEADLQPHAMLRSHEFRSGRRVFHVHFGHGYVKSIDEPEQPPSETQPVQPVQVGRSLSQTQNINCTFDNPKHKSVRLRAFYAVPKMVVIPSSSALRKQKLHSAIGSTPQSDSGRIALVRSLLATGSVRTACKLAMRWQLKQAFAPGTLVERLVTARCYAAAVRVAREFKLAKEHPVPELLHKMLEHKRYEGALKQVNLGAASVDGKRGISEVIETMLDEGQHALALKYVHKFGMTEQFPPERLVARCLEGDGELSVRTSAMLLKYVRLFALEKTHPIEKLLERIQASGVTVHEMDGKYVLKGRRRQVAQPGMSSSHGASPQPGTSPITSGAGSAPS